jgi:hypothetical protein
MAADLIDDFLTRLTQHIPQAAQAIPKLEAELRQHWGGTERTYIRKRMADSKRTAQVAKMLQQGMPLTEGFAAAGVSRATGYRHMAKPWTVKP